MIHPENTDHAQRVGDVDDDFAIFAQHRQEVGKRHFPPIDLAVLQGSGRGRRVRDGEPFEPVDENPFAARKPGGGLLPRQVAREFRERGTSARQPFVAQEAHRPAADMLVDLLEGIGRRDARGHDETTRRNDLAERQQHFRKGLFQTPSEGSIVERNQLVLDGLDHPAHRLARRPSVDARDRVRGEHRLAVVELEALPQSERPGEAVRR